MADMEGLLTRYARHLSGTESCARGYATRQVDEFPDTACLQDWLALWKVKTVRDPAAEDQAYPEHGYAGEA